MVTSQKRLMTLFKLNIGRKMLRFRKVALANLKIGKRFLSLANPNFQGLFGNKFDLKSSWLEVKIVFQKDLSR